MSETTPQTEQSGFGEMARAYWAVVRPERRLGIATIVLYSVSGLFESTALAMLVPLLAGSTGGGGGLFQRALEGLGVHGRAIVWTALGTFAVLSLLAAITKYAADSAMYAVRAKTEAVMRSDLTDRLLGMEWSSFLQLRFGEMASSLMMESSQVGQGVQLFLSTIGAFVVTLTFVALALVLSVKLTLLVVGFAVVALLVLRPLGRAAARHTDGLGNATTRVARQVTDVLGNLKFFRSTGSRTSASRLFSTGYDEYATWFQRTQTGPLVTRLIYEISALGFITILLSVSLAGRQTVSATTLAFLAIFLRLSPRVRDLQEGLIRARVQFPWLTAWNERRTSAAAHQATPRGTIQPTFERGLSVDRITYTFPNQPTPVLVDVSWELQPGQAVAFVGESGSGKTTMLDIITGLLLPDHGGVEVDGVSLGDIDVEAWQSRIGLVLQDSPLFHGTVRENVVSDREHDEDRVWECLRTAHAVDFVEQLPAKLDTVIGERGGRLSGGQRQRIALARALYRGPWLLALDEATSALDSQSEAIVLDALKELHGKVSMIIVAHRLATVELADRIFVLDRGKIVQSGKWGELMADSSGPFAQLAAKQGLTSASV